MDTNLEMRRESTVFPFHHVPIVYKCSLFISSIYYKHTVDSATVYSVTVFRCR